MKMARDAGLSRDQVYQYEAVAAIPADEFEQLLSAKRVPTLTSLVEVGRNHERARAGVPPLLKTRRVIVDFPLDELAALDMLAAGRGVSVAELLRDLVKDAVVRA